MKIRKLAKSTIALLIVIAILTGIVVAQILSTIQLNYNFSISTFGAIKAFVTGTQTPYMGANFDNFTAVGFQNSTFDVKNTGNIQILLGWNVTYTGYTKNGNYYNSSDGAFGIFLWDGNSNWYLDTPTALAAGAKDSMKLCVQCLSIATPVQVTGLQVFLIAS
jgi:hypothetical protein